jgi:small subunit ribosomal protein S24e
MGINEVKIEKDFNNKLLKRREVSVAMEYEGATPSRADIKQSVSDKFNMNKETMVVVRVDTLFGTNSAKILIHEYADKDSLKTAQKHTIARPNKKKEAAATVSANAEEPKAEKK